MRRFFDHTGNEFIQLGGGMEYVRKFEIVGLRWERFVDDQEQWQWRLRVYFNDAPYMTVYGDDASSVMAAFELPIDPPTPPATADEV